ncbi:MAG: tetratricopeptide repeat protein [Flavobacteriales bacterium]|nr:tetratricopeptide repeat protein [Flavobacteriales bacterium]|tara:strand:- start:793 stop:1476 length:684 start_codon:yes stop_codon:yes gene_type:complete
MTKKTDRTEEQLAAVEETLTNTEKWIESNQKILSRIVFVIVGVIAFYLGYDKFYAEPLNKEAHAEMFMAEKYFETDSFNLALNGDGQYLGFIDIASDYSGTSAGNLANYYAGICHLNLGDNESAIDLLSSFNANDEIVSSIAFGGIGDAYMNLGDRDKAISFYEKAAKNSNNKFTTPIYLKKAALAHESNGDYNEALEHYEKIKAEYGETREAADIDKYITRASLMQ